MNRTRTRVRESDGWRLDGRKELLYSFLYMFAFIFWTIGLSMGFRGLVDRFGVVKIHGAC